MGSGPTAAVRRQGQSLDSSRPASDRCNLRFGRHRFHGTLAESHMDHDSLILAVELFALVVFGALGLWRVYKHQQNQHLPERGFDAPSYDMRRDGQRLSSQ
jgi:hypothetical protein